jgi:hypothetical protein
VSTINKNIYKKKYDERCCQTGCDGCPYGFELNLDPTIPTEFQIEKLKQNYSKESEISEDQKKYLELADLY